LNIASVIAFLNGRSMHSFASPIVSLMTWQFKPGAMRSVMYEGFNERGAIV
jgi:hypothetical protein